MGLSILAQAQAGFGVTDVATRDAFRQALITRQCAFESTAEGNEVRKEIGVDAMEFAEIMLELTLRGEFSCPSGCYLRNEACDNLGTGS